MNPHDICYGAGFDPRFPEKLRPHQIAATQKYIDLRKTLSEEEYRSQIPPVPANMEPNGVYAEMKEIGSGSRNWTEERMGFLSLDVLPACGRCREADRTDFNCIGKFRTG